MPDPPLITLIPLFLQFWWATGNKLVEQPIINPWTTDNKLWRIPKWSSLYPVMPLCLNGPPEICSHWLILMGFTPRQWAWGSPGRTQGTVSLPLTGQILLPATAPPCSFMFMWMSLLWADHPSVTAPGMAGTEYYTGSPTCHCTSVLLCVCVENPFLTHNQMYFAFWSAIQGWVAPWLHQEWYLLFTYSCKWKIYKALIAIAVRHGKHTMCCTAF